MYFAIGGRKTQSGLYRVTYAGKESTAPVERRRRRRRGPRRCAASSKRSTASRTRRPSTPPGRTSSHADRFIRFAARVALEHQDPKPWRDQALAEKDPQAAIDALLALVRVSASDPFHRKPDDAAGRRRRSQATHPRRARAASTGPSSTDEQQLDLLRVYQVALQPPRPAGRRDAASADRAASTRVFPARAAYVERRAVPAARLPRSAERRRRRRMKLLADAPTQEEQIEYAQSLRMLKTGWTPELRKEYFAWFLQGRRLQGRQQLRRLPAATSRTTPSPR